MSARSSAKEVAKARASASAIAAVYADAAEEFGDGRIVGRALDNRMGGFIIAEVLRRLSRAKKRGPRASCRWSMRCRRKSAATAHA